MLQSNSPHLNLLTPPHCLPPQRIRASGLLLLEMILFGSLLLYFPVSRTAESLELFTDHCAAQHRRLYHDGPFVGGRMV